MDFNLVQIRQQAEAKEEENYRFRRFLKGECDLEPEEIDSRVFAATRRVWAGIDCTKCANCCREAKPGFSEDEVDRLARRLAMPREQFIETYLQRSEELDCETPWTTRTTPCTPVYFFAIPGCQVSRIGRVGLDCFLPADWPLSQLIRWAG